MEQVDDDIPYAREEVVEAGLRGLLAKGFFEDTAKQFRDVSEVLRVDADGVEGTGGDVELIAEAYVDVRDLALGSGTAGPECQGLEELLGGDEEMGDWGRQSANGRRCGRDDGLPDFSIWLSCCCGCMAGSARCRLWVTEGM